MTDHYPDHLVLADLPLNPQLDLFSEMDAIADELRKNRLHGTKDDRIAFSAVAARPQS